MHASGTPPRESRGIPVTEASRPTDLRRYFSLRPWVPYGLLVAGCLLSAGAAWYVSSTEEAHEAAEIDAEAKRINQQIENEFNEYVEVVRASTAMLVVSSDLNFADFRVFARGLGLQGRYRFHQGIGYVQPVRHRNLNSYVRATRLDGVSSFSVWPANRRAEHYLVISFESQSTQGSTLIGFDMSSGANLLAAMEHARDTGKPTASAALQPGSPFERVGQSDYVLFVPVYDDKLATGTEVERRQALVGFMFSPFKLAELLRDVAPADSQVAFDVFEETEGKRGKLVHAYNRGRGIHDLARPSSLFIAERNWHVATRPLQAHAGIASVAVLSTLLGGSALSFVLFLITRGQLRALETATRHEAELRESEQALRASELELNETIARERDARSQIEAADRAKDDFLATLSHELRTPLNTMLGWLAMLRTGSMREDQRVHALQVIERNARLQAQLIEDLLDVSRIVMGKVRLILHPVSVAPVISTVVESIRPTAEAKGVTVHAAVARDGGRIWGDSARLQQVVWNLLSNAVKFTSPGGRVSVQLTQDAHHLQLVVRDTGIGIAPEFLPHVFERFRQADSSMTRAHGGVGLGLAIVRDLVELHGGSIEAHSSGHNQGATFVVSLPALPAAAAAVLPTDDVHAAPVLSGVRVLVVDDDAETRVMLSEALSLTGAQVTTAKSAREAFEELTTHGADVLVSDVGMPDEDGLSLMRRIRSLPQGPMRVPAIALTAYARPSDRSRAMEAGYEMYFAKPVELAALQAGLAKLTGRDVHRRAEMK